MAVVESTQDVPLSATEDGTIRIVGTRITLDSVVHHYRQGATAEEIAVRFPGLRLADIHSCLAYYLNHHEEIGEYLRHQQHQADDLQRRISADPEQQQGIARMREQIEKRMATGREQSS